MECDLNFLLFSFQANEVWKALGVDCKSIVTILGLNLRAHFFQQFHLIHVIKEMTLPYLL